MTTTKRCCGDYYSANGECTVQINLGLRPVRTMQVSILIFSFCWLRGLIGVKSHVDNCEIAVKRMRIFPALRGEIRLQRTWSGVLALQENHCHLIFSYREEVLNALDYREISIVLNFVFLFLIRI